ncbi:MAG: hypothetical protein V4635_09080 [Bacteroidota bacterium]
MAENTKIVAHTDEFVHVKSETVPAWIKTLELLKDKIIEKLDSGKANEPTNLSPHKDK